MVVHAGADDPEEGSCGLGIAHQNMLAVPGCAELVVYYMSWKGEVENVPLVSSLFEL